MPRVRLVVDRPSADLWDNSERVGMLVAERNLSALQWELRPPEGGLWGGKATVRLEEGSYAWERLVRQGSTGVAWIYWTRDFDDAQAIDEETDLLWLGVAEDARVRRDGESVRLKLRGAGQFLKGALYTGSHEAESLHTIADAILQSVIDGGDTPVKAMDTENDGVLQTKVSIDFENTPVDRALADLAALAGGPGRVLWGVEPAAASSSFATAYFRLWRGHLYEKNTSVDRRVYTLSGFELLESEVEARNSDVHNEVTVIGDRKTGDPADASKGFYQATAKSPESIALYGRRRMTRHESSLRTDGQCAVLAAGLCKESASRRVQVRAKALVNLHADVVDGASGGKAYGLVQTGLKTPGPLVVLRDRARDYKTWGTSKLAYQAARDTTDPSHFTIDTAAGPTGADLVIQDPVSLSSGDKRLYVLKGIRGDMSYTTNGPGIFEIQKRLGALWLPSGGNWKLALLRLNAAGTTWNLLASSATTKTTAQLQAEHTLLFEVLYATATDYTFAGYFSDGTTTTQLVTSTEAMANVYATGTPEVLVLNGVGSGAGGTDPAVAGDCGQAKLWAVDVYRAWSGTTAAFGDTVGNLPAPFKRYEDMVLSSRFGLLQDADDLESAGWVRYAYGQTTRPGGFDAAIQYAGTKSTWAEVGDFGARNYDYAMGDSLRPREYGTHLEVLPVRAKVTYRGSMTPLEVEIRGEGGSRPQSELLEDLAGRIGQAFELERKGDA